ncbi:MAG: hypothetical protein M0P57_07315 [Syntrophales bacterium]|jgi:hypothetical protein|nr:hypothetical protein [Syntrophales bacterium]MDY0043028.1 hypothetical protein [Syntrophales bacterium]
MTKLKTGVAIFLVFCLGALAGSLGTHLYLKDKLSHYIKRDHRARAEYLLKKLTEELDLTEAQQQSIRNILMDSASKIREIDRKFRPEIKKIITQSFESIREELKEEQKPQFDEFITRLREKHEKRKDRAPPPEKS